MAAANILIIDDNAIVLRMIVNLVEDLGYTATGVRSAESGKACLERELFDVVLCDGNLGAGQTGTEFLSSDRTALPATLILMSAEPRTFDLPTHVNYLPKPFTIAQLEELLPLVG